MTRRPESCPLYPGKKEASGKRDGVYYRIGVLGRDLSNPKPRKACTGEELIGKNGETMSISVPCSRCQALLVCETHGHAFFKVEDEAEIS